ncbi:hypothetical protein BraRD5C2_58410 [Bradyrhizobium sp. RD5-C2]|nr:hypothetical protein BraRD5C2_58410 [Bradyrhizobium sp. RD5-C2]
MSLVTMDIPGLGRCRDCGGISTSSPVAEVKRTASESPYTIVVATILRRGAIEARLKKRFQIMFVSVHRIVGTLLVYRIGPATAPE